MSKSNILAGSNVYISRLAEPAFDSEFIKQIQDYKLLKKLDNRRKADTRVAVFTKEQEKILEIETRCIYAKKDPCWGFSKKKNRAVSACINDSCPKIFECNPKYNKLDAEYWKPSDADFYSYGDPKKMKYYYIVDMISDEEMSLYSSNLEYDGPVYPVDDPKESYIYKPETKIDPQTGKKMVVIGYRWMITDNARYENEELVPLWGFVNEIESEKKHDYLPKKAKRIEKIQNKESVLNGNDSILNDKDKCEKKVFESIISEIKLIKLEKNSFGQGKTVMVFSNQAEMALASGTLLINEIEHGLVLDDEIKLCLIDDFNKYNDRDIVLVSENVLRDGCKANLLNSWKALSEKKSIVKLLVGEREHYLFKASDSVRWTCVNMYGITHVCIDIEDIVLDKRLDTGIFRIYLERDSNCYRVLDDQGNLIGHTTEKFISLLKEFKDNDDIVEMPELIDGISLKIRNDVFEVLGIGHLKFLEY